MIPSSIEKMELVDLNFFSEYAPEFGFRLEFNALLGCRYQDSIYQTIMSVCPPASLYNA
jgi:hypothetical protein